MPVPCPSKDCAKTFDDKLDPALLLQLISLHASTDHGAAPAATTSSAAKPEKVKRPTISTSGTNEDFVYIQQRWSEYKQACKLTGPNVVFQLLECCEDYDVNLHGL